jgi:lipopolysaccharide transport system permease protein
MQEHHVRVRPPSRWGVARISDLFEFRELLYFLAKRELQVRYKQSFFGIGWAILQPLALTAIFSLIFGQLVDVPSDGVPYPLFALAGFTAWMYISQTVGAGGNSLVADASLLTKVYFPRMVLPLAKALALMVDLAIALVVLLIISALYGRYPHWQLVTLPLWLLLAFVTAGGLALLAAATNVRYRDVAAVMPLVIQVWLFLTPVAYPASLVSGKWEIVYALNPAASAITGLRWALLDTVGPSPAQVAVSAATALLILGTAVVYFRRNEQHFADVV